MNNNMRISSQKWMKTRGICFLLIPLLFSCTPSKESACYVVNIDPDSPQRTEQVFDSLFQYENHIILEETEMSKIKQIDKTVIKDGQIYLLDNHSKILVFDMDGNYLRHKNLMGHGRGECLNISDFDIKGDCLYVLDKGGSKINVYDLELHFKESIEVNAAHGIFVTDDGFALDHEFGFADGKSDKDYSYSYFKNGNYSYQIPFHPGLRGRSYGFSSGGNYFYEYDDSVFCFFPFNDMVYRLEKDGSLHNYMQIKVGERVVRPDASDQELDDALHSNIPTNIFAFYKFKDLFLFSFYDKNDKRVDVFYRLRNGFLSYGQTGLDSNGIPVSITSYTQKDGGEYKLLNIVTPEILTYFYRKHQNDDGFPVLNGIGEQIQGNGNPVLIFYRLRETL